MTKKEQNKNHRLKRKNYILKYKENKQCVLCGYNEYIEILQFHHFQGKKESNISTLQGKGAPISKIQEEINKCILLCPNCHFWHHFKESL